MTEPLGLFLVAVPGLEAPLAEEAREAGFEGVSVMEGGVGVAGGWAEAWRANLTLRGASRVLIRVAEFRALHLAQLDKRSRRLPWAEWLRADVPVKVEAACRASRIYHAGAAASRVQGAAEAAGLPGGEGGVRVMVRIEDDLCTISLDSSGEPLHRRGFKEAVGKAPLRETIAAMVLRECGFRGEGPVADPMCGSGTFVIEAAEIAAGLHPGRARAFAFERLATFDPGAWAAMKAPQPSKEGPAWFLGSDRDAGAVAMARANAGRAGVGALTRFERWPVSEARPPEGPPGLVVVNPPYGARIGERAPLHALHAALGRALRDRFGGWRVGIVTPDAGLARATGLPFEPPGPPLAHGGISVRLWRARVPG